MLQGGKMCAPDVSRAADEHAERRGIQGRTSAMVATYQNPYLECRSFHYKVPRNYPYESFAVQLMKSESCCM
jgi:hypothetical protein